MPTFPPDQKIPKQAKKKNLKAPQEKTPRAKFQDPSFETSQGDLGIKRDMSSAIPRMAKAPTRTGDSISNHVGKVAAVLKQSGMMG